MFIYDSLSSLTMTGEDAPDCIVSAKSIGTITLSGFSVLSSSVLSVENVDIINVIPNKDGLKICNGALAGISANMLCIDMTDAYLDVNALCGLSANEVMLVNFAKAYVKPYVDRLGLGLKSFAGCIVKSIGVLTDDFTEHDANILHELLSSNMQHIADGCSINGNALRTSCGNVIMKPASRHLFIDHVDDEYVYSAVSCNLQ